MTRAMDTLILTRAVYRRRYGTDLPEASVPSRFLEEVPAELIEELGTPRRAVAWTRRLGRSRRGRVARATRRSDDDSSHYAYEDEDQSASLERERSRSRASRPTPARPTTPSTTLPSSSPRAARNSACPKLPVEEPKGKKGFRPGQKVRHPKYGEGTVYQREGEGEDAKITVQFPRFGLKKLVEKYAQLEGVSS